MSITPAVRKRIYEISVAVFGLLVTLGFVTEEISTQVILIAAAVLGVGDAAMARVKVERAPDADEPVTYNQ